MTVGLISFANTSLYQGFVATAAGMLSTQTSSFNISNSETQHVATDNLTSIKLVASNFVPSNPDIGTGSASTVAAGIRYSGVTTPVTWGGGSTGTIPNSGSYTLESDYTTVSIPKGATFWVREYQNNPTGFSYIAFQGSGESFVCATTATGLTNQSAGTGAFTGGTAQTWTRPPLAIVGFTRTTSVLLIGDSRTADATRNPSGGMIAPSLIAAGVAFVNLAVSGDSAHSWLANNAVGRLSIFPYGSQIINALGINDLNPPNNITPATLISNLNTINSWATAAKKYNTTLPPYTSSANGWISPQDQVNLQSNVVPFNDLVRTGGSPQTGFYEIGDTVMSAHDSGFWSVTNQFGQTPTYTIDGLHPNAAGDAVILAANCIVPATYP